MNVVLLKKRLPGNKLRRKRPIDELQLRRLMPKPLRKRDLRSSLLLRRLPASRQRRDRLRSWLRQSKKLNLMQILLKLTERQKNFQFNRIGRKR